jgi:hypothetical protein
MSEATRPPEDYHAARYDTGDRHPTAETPLDVACSRCRAKPGQPCRVPLDLVAQPEESSR